MENHGSALFQGASVQEKINENQHLSRIFPRLYTVWNRRRVVCHDEESATENVSITFFFFRTEDEIFFLQEQNINNIQLRQK